MHPFGVLSLIPPVVVLVVGYVSKQVYLPLISGILAGAFIASQFSIPEAIFLSASRILEQFELTHLIGSEPLLEGWNILIGLFFLELGFVLKLIHASGGAKAYSQWIESRFKSRVLIESSSLMLSLCLFVDDYFSSLTVGSVMRVVTDKLKIARAKLAFLVDALASPLTMVCPVSSWVAAIVGFLKEGGVSPEVSEKATIIGSPYIAYLNLVPYISYSWLIFFAAWFIVITRTSYGTMAQRERYCLKTGDVHGGIDFKKKKTPEEEQHCDTKAAGKVADFAMPVFFLTSSILTGIICSGIDFSQPFELIVAMRHASAAKGLFTGGSAALLLTILFLGGRRRVSFKTILRCAKDGVTLMAPSILVLVLAWAFGAVVRHDLQTGLFIAKTCAGSMPSMLFPVVFFLVSFAIAFSLGTSWGAAAILFPIGIQMILALPEYSVDMIALEDILPVLAPSLAAALSGAVAGDHVSPISDTTIMSSASTSMSHHDHVRTQLDYAWPVILTCCLSYLIYGVLNELGLSFPWAISLFSSWCLLATIYTLMDKRERLKQEMLQS